jgi:hypothetical protein
VLSCVCRVVAGTVVWELWVQLLARFGEGLAGGRHALASDIIMYMYITYT